MKDARICPRCGSDHVGVIDSKLYGSDARWRWRACQTCGHKYTSVSLTESVITIETVTPLALASVVELRTLLKKIIRNLG